ncbi:MAG: hypothetical protein JWO38_1397 [Gemmataceae bacterium]|nr:hypothetical protein [Gemmataceae bacterium]
MIRSSGSGRWVDALWLVAFGVASSAWCLTAAHQLGATFDEPLYLNAGLTSWRTGSNKLLMSAGTMPLPVDVQTLPIYLWEQSRGVEFHQYKEIETILPVARAANLVFWWILLVYAMKLGRTWGGAWAGRLAVGFLACDPNFLGHAALATTDISVVAGMLALVYHFHHGQGRGWGRRVFVPGVCYGLAVLAKASGMVFGAQAMLAIGLYHLARTGALAPPPGTPFRGKLAHLWRASYQLRRDLFWIALIGFTLVFGYTGSDWGTEWTFIAWADGLPDGLLKSVMVPISHNLTIFPNAGEALLQQVKHNLRGHGTYLLGEWYPRACWAYFPVALTMKTPAPVLALLLAVLVLRPRDLNTPAGWVALVLLAFSLNCRVQIGIRFVFTLMAVTYVAVAVAVARGWQAQEAGSVEWRVVPRWLVGGLLAATGATAVWVWPHGLSYFNQLWGGPEVGYTRLHDSNYDWGQGLPDLKAWHAAHGQDRPLAVWYYGTDPAILYPPFRYVAFSHLPLSSAADARAAAGDGYLAVGVGILHGDTGATPSTRVAADWLRTLHPVARTHTFVIYDLRK